MRLLGQCARHIFVFIQALIFSLAGPDLACAGAWLQAEGKGQIIVTSSFDRSDRFFNASGKLQPLAQYRKFEMTTYTEYGATDWLTLMFAPSSSQSIGSVGIVEAADRYARIEAGARARVWQDENSIVSFQASVRAPYAMLRAPPPGLRREVNEIDLRMLYGYSFQLWDRSGFAGAEIAYRYRAGAGDEWRADFTLGYRPLPQFLLLLQNFNTMTKAALPARAMRSHKLQASGVYDLTENWSLQAGVFVTVLGENVRRERGVAGGLWRRF